jgi:ribonuclease R
MTKKKFSKDPFSKREAEKYANPVPSREYILLHLEKIGKALRWKELAKVLGITTAEEREGLRRRLNAMFRDGQIISNRRGEYALVDRLSLIKGVVTTTRQDFGFLVPDDQSDDIFLSSREMKIVFPGDRVLVSICSHDRRGKKREGRVVEILERSFTQVIGRYHEEKGVCYVVPMNKGITEQIIIPGKKNKGAKNGEMVVVQITTYPTYHRAAIGEVSEVLGERVSPQMELELTIRAYGLPWVWSKEINDEIKKNSFKKSITPLGRKDLRDLFFVTIDGEDAKDFDDAVYCEKQKDGWLLYVAIADVSHYVKPDTYLDKEAFSRGNSVYFPGKVIPMLPEILANDLCSLKPEVDRLVMVCEVHLSETGAFKNYQFYQGIIHSHARLTYNQVFKILETNPKLNPKLLKLLKELKSLYQILLKQRQLRGALEFSTIESRIVLGKGYKIKKIEPVIHHYVHGIIEECMLVANVCASRFLLTNKMPALYRVHEGPDVEKLTALRDFLHSFGLSLKGGDSPKPYNYAELLQAIKGRMEEHLIQTVLLRSLKQAVYTPENVGHFGLAYQVYSHFTSPIRRYPDLITHRAIKHVLEKKNPKKFYYDFNHMANFGQHCSMTERRADDASRDIESWLKCEFMQDKIGAVFPGIISGVTNFGVFVELKDIYVEGLVHITSLKNDYYELDSAKHVLKGKRTRASYRLGDPIKVRVVKINLEEREIDFDLGI